MTDKLEPWRNNAKILELESSWWRDVAQDLARRMDLDADKVHTALWYALQTKPEGQPCMDLVPGKP